MTDLGEATCTHNSHEPTESYGPVESYTDEGTHSVLLYFLNIYIPLCVSLCGVVSNTLNIVIFWKLGFKDSMSVGLFALSFTDFLATFLYAVVCLCYLTDTLYPTNPIDAWALGYFAFGWMMNAAYMMSCWITAMISTERCFCVVSPFKIKRVFTRSRFIVAILTIYVVHVGLHVPIYVLHRMEWVNITTESTLNGSIPESPAQVYTIIFNEETARVEMIFDVTVSLPLSDLSLTIVVVCTVSMVYSLSKTSRVRLALNAKSPDSTTKQPRTTLSLRERKLVKVVLTLAITLSVCAIPRIIVVAVYNSLPGINVGPLPRYIIIMWAVAYICNTLGCSITIVVYLILNSNYRAKFYQCFKRSK